ncbi:MAG: type IV toxin-antitoxin system AbiEi family antitoxin domain-containing protein [Deltaproteobacteria bacterium]|nr:type IV toxin-antitoxin system AbiEi family antitoxin domain-containing protein [Deltaproteobacteria bacterium]
MARSLGNLERQAFAYAQLREQRIIATGDLSAPLGITAKKERELLSRLSRAGLIARVRNGLYLFPAKLPLGRRWSPDEALALNTLLEDRDGRYQVCGPNAFNRYGFDEQVPTLVYAYNNRISGARQVGAVALSLIKVADERLGDTAQIETAAGNNLVFSSRTRTLVDAVYDWSRFGSLPKAYGWIRSELSAGRVEVKTLVRSALQFGNQGTIRRLGALLEEEGASARQLGKLDRALTSKKSLIPMVPRTRAEGKVDRRWGVVRNDQS